MSTKTETIKIPHLGNSTIGYRFGRPYNHSLPTLVLVNSFGTSVELYRPQFSDEKLAGAVNLLAIELFGHGQTRSDIEQFTYWDSAIANLQVLKALNIASAFVLGTSQGGWVAARMAMLEPESIKGIMPLGTSMDFESQRSREIGCWDGIEFCTPAIDALADPVPDDWTVAGEFVDGVLAAGLGDNIPAAEIAFWHATFKENYAGDEGRKRLRMCSVNLRDRDGLHGRLDAVRCPVLWMHGTNDQVYSVRNAQEEIKMLVNAPAADLQIVEKGQHFLSASNPDAVNAAAYTFIKKYK